MLSEFYCKYCGTTQYLKPRKNRATCGNAECTKKKRVLDLREKRKKNKQITKRKTKKEYGGERKVSFGIEISGIIETVKQYREYSTCNKISEITSNKVFLFGKNYVINRESSTNKVLITNVSDGRYLVILDNVVQIRDSKESLKGIKL